ncbi:MAG: D-lactate dehydrogenase (cytochrome) [Ilumatobacteraceae bacterium]|nr:D-lactate dehydrogenase (cytochrome) [Ilumatobacteraceae bacterium]
MAVPILDDVIDEFIAVVGRRHVITDPSMSTANVVDWTRRFVGTTPAVVRPGSTAEVAAIIDICRRHDVALVPQGGNTGMVGGSVPLSGEVVLSLARLDRIDPVDIIARQVTVQAGVAVSAVQAAAHQAGLRYAVDLGSRDTATIGGTIATNAGGVNMLRYGGTREQTIGIEAVLGTGQVVSRLGGLLKDNTGYHLPSLLCGSEGTLGVVTAARLRLVTSHEHRVTALIGFGSIGAAVDAVAQWRSSIDSLDAAELVLAEGVDLVCRAFDLPAPFDRRWPALVLIEAAAHDDPSADLAAAVGRVADVGDVAVATDHVRRRALWRYREDHTLAIGTIGVPHKFDVTVPLGVLAEFVERMPSEVSRIVPQATTYQFGHVGDGNIHLNVVGIQQHDGPLVDRLDEVVYGAVQRVGGSISAEHGIGTAKAKWLHLNRSADEIGAMRAIKHALDPDGVLNPNVLLGPVALRPVDDALRSRS